MKVSFGYAKRNRKPHLEAFDIAVILAVRVSRIAGAFFLGGGVGEGRPHRRTPDPGRGKRQVSERFSEMLRDLHVYADVFSRRDEFKASSES